MTHFELSAIYLLLSAPDDDDEPEIEEDNSDGSEQAVSKLNFSY